MEIADVVKFLGETTPFDHTNPAALSELAAKVKVYYFKAQDNVSIDSNRLLIVRTGIFALFSDQQQLLTKLQPGDFYGYQLLLTGLADNDQLVCEEDGLLFWLPADAFHQLRYQYKNIDIFFQRLFGRRLHQYKEQQSSHGVKTNCMDLVSPCKNSCANGKNEKDNTHSRKNPLRN